MSAQLGTFSKNPNEKHHDRNNNHSTENIDNFTALERLITITSLPMTLKVATELDIFSIIARVGSNRQLSAAEIAAELSTKNPKAASMLDRMLRLLASYSILTYSVAANNASNSSIGPLHERLYGLAPLAEYLVPDQDGLSLAPLLPLALHDSYFRSWSKLKDAVIEGGDAFTIAHGQNVYDYGASNPADRGFNEALNKGMFNCSTILLKKILKSYNGFKDNRIKVLVDVGGGLGHNIRAIVSKHPSIKGVNFDLPHVIQDAAIPCSGVEHVSGDMFVAVPPGDAIFMNFILHNWGDEFCVKLLKNCYKSLPENGKVIIVDRMLPTTPETTVTAKALSQLDIMMMTQLPSGKGRSREDYIVLANAAGFLDIVFIGPILSFWVLELYKQSSY